MTEHRPCPGPDSAPAGPGPEAAGADMAEVVESELERARRAADEYLADLRRVAADFDNYRKRVARDAEAQATRAAESLVSELLPVLDNLERALDASEHHEEAKVSEGVQLVRQQLSSMKVAHASHGKYGPLPGRTRSKTALPSCSAHSIECDVRHYALCR